MRLLTMNENTELYDSALRIIQSWKMKYYKKGKEDIAAGLALAEMLLINVKLGGKTVLDIYEEIEQSVKSKRE